MRLLVTALLMIAPTIALAQATPAPPPAKSGTEKKICHFDVDTGSMFRKRTCHTKAEWAAIAATNAKNTDSFQHHRQPAIPTSLN